MLPKGHLVTMETGFATTVHIITMLEKMVSSTRRGLYLGTAR